MHSVRPPTAHTAQALTPAERRLASVLRFFAVLFAIGALGFFIRPDGTVSDLNRIGALLGLGVLPPRDGASASDFWLVLAVANMTTITACAWLAAQDIRARQLLAYPLIVSKLTSSTCGLILFLTRGQAFPYLVALLVDLPIALIVWRALHAARST